MGRCKHSHHALLSRAADKTALGVVGGAVPLAAEEFARRAYLYQKNPLRNTVKEVMDAFSRVEGCFFATKKEKAEKASNLFRVFISPSFFFLSFLLSFFLFLVRVPTDTPPMLGIFNDIPWHKIREDEVQSWAKAGFSWVVQDGEHTQQDGRYGREQNAMIARAGMLPVQVFPRHCLFFSSHGKERRWGRAGPPHPVAHLVPLPQRLHREAISEHGDQFQLGARATMRPYGTTLEEAEKYYKAVHFPIPGAATPDDRLAHNNRCGSSSSSNGNKK